VIKKIYRWFLGLFHNKRKKNTFKRLRWKRCYHKLIFVKNKGRHSVWLCKKCYNLFRKPGNFVPIEEVAKTNV
jgi:hypothetical protein